MVTPINPEPADDTEPEIIKGPAFVAVAAKLTPVIPGPLTVCGLLVGLNVTSGLFGVRV